MSPERNVKRARIYVSFAGQDRARAMQLVRWLNDSGWHVLADDRHALAAGESWTWSPDERLASSDVIMCVITPGWLESEFCHYEFSHCAKRGKFILPVICEPSDAGLLPPAMRALPRVDLTHEGMVDYLALRDALSQVGPDIGYVAAEKGKAQRISDFAWRLLHRPRVWVVLGALLLASIASLGLWLWQ